ncbi:hypothetical protein J4217_04245 [Candidatus Pacearchaeota archaeon]|nr:hypothetical protein [Candidatus Pacearchaeota archaeon]
MNDTQKTQDSASSLRISGLSGKIAEGFISGVEFEQLTEKYFKIKEDFRIFLRTTNPFSGVGFIHAYGHKGYLIVGASKEHPDVLDNSRIAMESVDPNCRRLVIVDYYDNLGVLSWEARR